MRAATPRSGRSGRRRRTRCLGGGLTLGRGLAGRAGCLPWGGLLGGGLLGRGLRRRGGGLHCSVRGGAGGRGRRRRLRLRGSGGWRGLLGRSGAPGLGCLLRAGRIGAGPRRARRSAGSSGLRRGRDRGRLLGRPVVGEEVVPGRVHAVGVGEIPLVHVLDDPLVRSEARQRVVPRGLLGRHGRYRLFHARPGGPSPPPLKDRVQLQTTSWIGVDLQQRPPVLGITRTDHRFCPRYALYAPFAAYA